MEFCENMIKPPLIWPGNVFLGHLSQGYHSITDQYYNIQLQYSLQVHCSDWYGALCEDKQVIAGNL